MDGWMDGWMDDCEKDGVIIVHLQLYMCVWGGEG